MELPGALFHGGSRDVGSSILPRSVHKQGRANAETGWEGRPDYGAGQEYLDAQRTLDEYYREHKAYATPHEDKAWSRYAHATADRGGGRGRVYEVEAPWDEDVDLGAFAGEYVANRFDVTHQHDIRSGRQGTLPLDWRPHVVSKQQMMETNPYKASNILHGNVWVHETGVPTDEFANHPTNYQRTMSGDWDSTEEHISDLQNQIRDMEPDPNQESLFKTGRVTGRLRPRRF